MMMRPLFNTNQPQTNGTSAPPPQQQQVRPCNNFQGNSVPNSGPQMGMMNTPQIPNQMGMMNNPQTPNQMGMMNNPQTPNQMGMMNNPQIPNPYNNFNIHPNNPNMPNRPNSAQFFMNAPNAQHPSSCFNNPTFNGTFPLQNAPGQPYPIFNMGPMMMGQMNNTSQPNVPFFAPNSLTVPPYFNQQGPMYQFVPMQMPNYNPQLVQSHMPIMFPNQLPQTMVPQNVMQPSQVSQMIGGVGGGHQSTNIVMKPQFGPGNSNGILPHGNQEQQQQQQQQQQFGLPSPNLMVNGPTATRQLDGTNSSHSVQPSQTQNFSPGFVKSQGNHGKEFGVNVPISNWKNSPIKNMATKGDASHKGFFHQAQDANGKFKFGNQRGEKAYKGARKLNFASSSQILTEKKRFLPLNYTEEEIRQWREARKKNFPSKDNVDKKLTEREIADADAKLRRQQLKEILAKQAELGCEVAELPSGYLSDSKKPMDGSEDNKKAFGNKRNKFNKRGKGRFSKNDKFSNLKDEKSEEASFNKKQRVEESSNLSMNSKKEPRTLLQKLLSTDIRRDKAHLLQVFRFMVMNSYLKDYSSENKYLRFPHVVVKQVEDDVGSKISGNKLIEEVNCNDDRTRPQVGKDSSSGLVEEEEGEIID